MSCLRLEIYGSGHVYTFPQLLELYGKVNCENRTLPSKHSSWWRRTEDVLKMSWRRLQCNIFLSFKTSSKRLQEDVLQTRIEDVLKTSWKRLEDFLRRRLEDVFGRRFANMSSRGLQDVFKDQRCYTEEVLKTSWRRLGKQEIFARLCLKSSLCWPLLMHLLHFLISKWQASSRGILNHLPENWS